jgi:hypothetical protein
MAGRRTSARGRIFPCGWQSGGWWKGGSGTAPPRAVPETGHGGKKMNINKKELTQPVEVEP